MFPQHQIIEYIVLFKVKPDVDSTKVAAMVDELNGPASINLTIHFQINRRSQCLLGSSRPLACRYYILPIIEDIMDVDWISNCTSDSPKPGSAMRVILLKLKQDLVENEKSKLVDQVIEGIKNQFKTIKFISFGENFSNAMSKGYSFDIMAVFPTPADFETSESKLKDLIESELVVDYVFPPLNVANQFSFNE